MRLIHWRIPRTFRQSRINPPLGKNLFDWFHSRVMKCEFLIPQINFARCKQLLFWKNKSSQIKIIRILWTKCMGSKLIINCYYNIFCEIWDQIMKKIPVMLILPKWIYFVVFTLLQCFTLQPKKKYNTCISRLYYLFRLRIYKHFYSHITWSKIGLLKAKLSSWKMT